MAGGFGFVVGDFVNMLGRAQWGPTGHLNALQGLDYWKWMEQLFGLVMGLGTGLAFLGYARPKLASTTEDKDGGTLNTVALLFLLLVMMWSNLFKNVPNWAQGGHILRHLFGISIEWWFLLVGIMLSATVVIAITRQRLRQLPLAPRSPFGKAQLLFLMILWVAIIGAFMQAFPKMTNKGVFFVHVTFWITGAICSLVVLNLPEIPKPDTEQQLSPSDRYWRIGKKYRLTWLLIPILILLIGYLTVSSHDKPLPGSHLCFVTTGQ